MLRKLFSKLLRTIAILICVMAVTFLLMHAIPGNPWSNYSSDKPIMTNIGVETDINLAHRLNQRFGLDLPLWRQFTRYIIGDFDASGRFFCGVICGNLGPSIQLGGRTVQDAIFQPARGKTFWASAFGYSIRLVLLASLIAVGLGIPLGIASAMKPRSRLSHAISVGLAALISIPNFILGLLAIIIFAAWLHLIPVLPNWNQPTHWLIPGIVLATMPMANIARVTQTSLINILGEDYVRTARAKGLTPRRVMLVHVLRNALVTIITYLGPTLVELFAGLFIVENLYGFPGFGRQYWVAVITLDYPMILGLTLLYATGMTLINLLVEVSSVILDPRLRAIQQEGAL